MHRDNPGPQLGSPGVVLLGHDAGFGPGGWAGNAGSSELAGCCGRGDQVWDFFFPKASGF